MNKLPIQRPNRSPPRSEGAVIDPMPDGPRSKSRIAICEDTALVWVFSLGRGGLGDS